MRPPCTFRRLPATWNTAKSSCQRRRCECEDHAQMDSSRSCYSWEQTPNCRTAPKARWKKWNDSWCRNKWRYRIDKRVPSCRRECECEKPRRPLPGKTPLDLANQTNQKETADRLRQHGGKLAKDITPKPSPLANCNVCKRLISRNAKICPHCGEPNPSR